jgi:hypothetical protein
MNDMKARYDLFQSRLNRLTDEFLRNDIRLIFIALTEQLNEIKGLQENFLKLEYFIDKKGIHAGTGPSADGGMPEIKERTPH